MSKVYNVLNKIYAVMMCVSFLAGIIPVIPFLIALFVGGEVGQIIYNICFKYFFPYVIALGSLSIIVGLIAMYVGKIEDLSLKSMEKPNK